MVERTTFQDILTCVIAVIIFILQSLHHLMTWINQFLKYRRNTVFAVTTNTTKPSVDNALENFIRVQQSIQKHFDIPLIDAEEESKVDESIQNTQCSTSSNNSEEKDEFVNRQVDDSYVARGFGLIAATAGRQSEFYLYSKYGYNFENIIVELKGRNFETGRATIFNQNHSSPEKSKSIPIDYAYDDDRIKVTYIPYTEGVHTLTLLRNGVHICRSPYYISVEKSPTNSRSRIRLGTKKSKMITKFGRGKCTSTEMKYTPIVECFESFTKVDVQPLTSADNYKGMDVMSIVTKFESKSAGKKIPKRTSNVTEKSPERDLSDNGIVDSDEQPETNVSNDNGDQNQNNNPEIDLKLKKVNLKYANESNDICEKTADGDRRQNTKSKTKTIHNETSVKTIYCSDAPQNVSPSISLQDESSYKTEILDQTSVISQQLQKHNDREMVLSTHQSKKINFTDDEIHTKNEIYREKKPAVLKENIKEPNQTSNTAQQITDWKQYSISSPLASFITNITNDMCEKCSKQVFIIISELFRDINKKHNTNSNEICLSFKTLLAQPNKNDTNIDDVLENTSREATDQFKSACSKINDAIHLEPENADEDTNLKHESTDKIKALCNNNKSSINDTDNKTNFELMNEQKKDNNEINRALTQNVANNSFVVVTNCNVEIAEHQKNELPLNKLELQKAVSEIVMPNNALCVDNIKNSDNKLESHDSKTQTNSAHDIDLIKSNYCEEKYLYEDSDLVLETDDSSIERNKHVIKGTHIQQTDSEIQNCTLSSPTTNAQLEKIKITKLEQTIDVCDVNNSYLNKKQAIEKFIEPVLNSFKNKMVERIVQLLTVKENSLNTNVRQHLDNYNTNKNAERPKQQNLSNTENNAIENNKTLIKQEKDHITKNEVSDIISNKDQTNSDLFEHIKTYFKIFKNTHEINAEEVSKKFCTAVLNTKMHRLNDNRLNVVYDINCDQKRKNDTCKQEIQLVTSTLNDAKIMLENESKNDQLEKLNTEVISTKQLQSCILKDRNALLQEVTINFETKTTDDQNFQQTETIIPLSDNYKTNDLKNKNTTEHETTFFNQPLNEPESKVIKKSDKRIMEPLSSSSHENHNSNTSVLQPETTSETKLLDFPTKVNTEKLCSTTIGTTTEKSPNKISSDGVEKLSRVDTEILPEESTKTKNFQNEITQETIEDINATETETMKVKNAMSNESEFKTVVETLISADNAISVEPIEIENNKRSKTLSELNKVDCTSLQIVDKKTEFQLPSLINVNNITVKNKTKSNEMQSIIDSLCSNCTAIVTIKTDTQSNILSPITTLTIEVQEPNTVVIENLSNIEIKNITKNYKANLKRETEIKHVEETPLTAKSTILLSNTINTNELNNIEILLKVVDTNVLTEIQKSNEINVVEIDKDQTNKIDESAENSVIVIESKNKIENTSDIFIANTPLFSVEESKSKKNIYADKKTSKLDHTLITTMEQSKKSETITTPVIEESDNIETTFCKENQVFSDTCVPNILLDTQSKKVLTENTSIFLEANNINDESSDKLENTFIKLSPKLNKYETENTSKNHIPAVDISYESIHTSIELECEPIVLDSSSSTTQAILMDENKLKMKSETIVSTDNATTQLNKLNKEMLQITPITPVTSNTLVGAIKTRNKLKSKTTHNTLVTNNMSATFTDMKELQIIPEAMVSNETLITPQKTFNKEKIQTTSKLLKDDHIDGIDKSKPFTTKYSKKMSWSDDSSTIPNQELSENYEIHTLLKKLEPKYVPIKSLETPNAIVNFKDNLSEIQVSKNISEVLVKKSVKTNGKTKIKSLISHDTYDGVKKQTKEEEECICKNNKEIIHQMNIENISPMEKETEVSEKKLLNKTETLPTGEILKTAVKFTNTENISLVEEISDKYEKQFLNSKETLTDENKLKTTIEITNSENICPVEKKANISEEELLNITKTLTTKEVLETTIEITNSKNIRTVKKKSEITEDNLLKIIENISDPENPLLNNMETLPTEEFAKTSVEFANTETIIPVEKETEIFEKQILNIVDNFPMEKIFEKTIETTNTGKICSIEEETEISEENFFNTTETLETDKILENLIKITNPEDTNTVKEKSKISEKECFNITKHLPREEYLLSTGETINTDEINPVKMRTEISEKKLLNNTESLLTEEILKTNIEITQTENKVEKETEISEEQRLNILDNLPNENILEATIETTNTEKLGLVEKKPEISKAAFLNTTKPFQIEDLIENAINITNTENSKQTEITKEPFFNIIETLPIEKNLETDIQISNTERITPVEKETEIPEKHLLNITETIPAGVILETAIKYTNSENISPVENKTKISEDRLINMTKTSTAVEVLDTTIKITNFENIRKVENEIEITEGNCLHVKEIISTENISDSIIEIKNSENISPVDKDTRKNEGQLLNIKDTVGNEEKLQNIIETTNSEDVCPHKKETKTTKEQLINITKTLPREEDLITTIDIINIDKINSVEMNTEISEETLLNKTETLLTEEISKTNIKTTVDKETEISEKQLINILDYLPTENISEATIEKINTGKICPVEENNEISEDNLFDNINQNISDSDTTIKIKNMEIRCPYETKISKKQLLYDMETLSTEEIAKTSIKIANTGIIIPVEKHTEAFEESILNITNTGITTGDILKTAIEITNAENLNPVDKETEISEKQLINILDNLPMENISETTIEKTITGKICPVEENNEVSGDNLFNIINQNISDSDTTIEIKNTEIRCPYDRETKISEKQLLYDMETLPTEEIAKTSIEIANTGIIIPVEKHTKASEESILNITNRAITTGDILETTIEITIAENLSPVDKETEISEKQLINILDNCPTENILEKTFKLTNTRKICPVKEKNEISADYNRFIMETLPTEEITKTSIKNTETTVEKHTESSEESLSNILETHSSEEILETSNKITNTESTVDREIKIPGKLLLNDTKTFPSEDMLDTTIEITNTEKVSLDEKKTEISQEPLKISTETIPTEAGTFIEFSTSENINPVENQTIVSGKILSNVMETLPTKRTSEPLPEEDENFNFYECVEFVRPMTVNVETLSDLIDKSNNNETDHKIYDSKITKKKNTVAGELKYYMKIDNTYDSLISKTTPQNKIYEDFDELNELEKKQLTVDGAEIKIADSNKSMESVCEHQNITLNSNSSIEDNNENTLEARFESNDTETEFYGELDHPTITVFKKNNFGDDNEKIDDQKIIINRGESSQECSCSAAANDNADDENVYGVQKLEMSLQCTKTSNDDYFEKTFVKLQKTEKISIDQNQSDDDSTTLSDEKSYIVNESDLNAILCASSLEEALTLLDSKINLRFKNRNKTRKPSGIIDSTMYKQSLQSRYTSSNNSEKNANFAEAQEFFKNIEKN